MIIDKLENAELYENVHPGFAKVVEWLRTVADPDMPEGRHDIEGYEHLCRVYKWDKTSRPYDETPMEIHTKSIDFHFVMEGTEILGWEPIAEGEQAIGEKPEDDIIMYPDRNSQSFHLEQGDIYLIWPHEGHKSGCHFDKPYHVKKIVGKLLLE